MIPYFPAPKFHLYGDVSYHLFGFLVSLGIILGILFVYKQSAKAGIEKLEITKSLWATLGLGFLLSHVVSILFYHPERINSEGLLVLLKFWDGMSSLGGFLGGFLGMAIMFKRLKTKAWIMTDIILQALIIGWVFGRLGCAFAHDHPGALTDFFLAFNYPGGPRHNLGFYEFLFTLFILLPYSFILQKRKPQPGTLVAWTCLLYSLTRFGLDFLRASDIPGANIRYLGLTFAQHGCIFLFLFGTWLFFHLKKNLINSYEFQ